MPTILIVGLGGFMGAIARFQISEWCNSWSQNRFGKIYPMGTLVVNAVGCLLIGLLMTLVLEKQISERAKLLWVTGCLGSLTTFSTFGLETVQLIRESKLSLAFGNIAANLIIGLLAVAAGIGLGRLFVPGQETLP
jgi:fluoride exporter